MTTWGTSQCVRTGRSCFCSAATRTGLLEAQGQARTSVPSPPLLSECSYQSAATSPGQRHPPWPRSQGEEASGFRRSGQSRQRTQKRASCWMESTSRAAPRAAQAALGLSRDSGSAVSRSPARTVRRAAEGLQTLAWGRLGLWEVGSGVLTGQGHEAPWTQAPFTGTCDLRALLQEDVLQSDQHPSVSGPKGALGCGTFGFQAGTVTRKPQAAGLGAMAWCPGCADGLVAGSCGQNSWRERLTGGRGFRAPGSRGLRPCGPLHCAGPGERRAQWKAWQRKAPAAGGRKETAGARQVPTPKAPGDPPPPATPHPLQSPFPVINPSNGLILR